MVKAAVTLTARPAVRMVSVHYGPNAHSDLMAAALIIPALILTFSPGPVTALGGLIWWPDSRVHHHLAISAAQRISTEGWPLRTFKMPTRGACESLVGGPVRVAIVKNRRGDVCSESKARVGQFLPGQGYRNGQVEQRRFEQ